MIKPFDITGLDTVTPTKITWLWRNRIPLGQVSILTGGPERMIMAMAIAADVTTGLRKVVDSSDLFDAADVLHIGGTLLGDIRAYADAAGGDPSRIFNLKVGLGDVVEGFREQAKAQVRRVRLLIVESVGNQNALDNCLPELQSWARDSGAAILVLTGITSASDANNVDRYGIAQSIMITKHWTDNHAQSESIRLGLGRLAVGMRPGDKDYKLAVSANGFMCISPEK